MTEYVLKVDGKEFPLPAQSRDFCNTIHEVGETDNSVFEAAKKAEGSLNRSSGYPYSIGDNHA